MEESFYNLYGTSEKVCVALSNANEWKIFQCSGSVTFWYGSGCRSVPKSSVTFRMQKNLIFSKTILLSFQTAHHFYGAGSGSVLATNESGSGSGEAQKHTDPYGSVRCMGMMCACFSLIL
jgi:hypothetical protein